MITCDELYKLISNLNSEKEYIEKYEELIKIYNTDTDKYKLDLVFYDLYEYEYINSNETYEKKIKRIDKKFKKSVTQYYKSCIITKRSLYVCEVAHIYPFADSELEDKYNPLNGVLLCRDMHKLFDNKLITINPIDYRLTLSPEILSDDTLVDYIKYNNIILDINLESRHYFEKLYK